MQSPGESVDIERFGQQVASISDRLEAIWTGGDAWSSRRLGALSSDDRAIEEFFNQLYRDATAKAGASLGSKEEIRAAALAARSALQTPSTRSIICRALRPITGKTSREIVIELIKKCLPLALAGQLAVPALPLVWGLLGFTVTCVGTTWLCGDQS